MAYFQEFPYVSYQFPNDNIVLFKNLSIRPVVIEAIKSEYDNLELYFVQDGETPETLAFDNYGDASLNWIIMLANNIINLYKDWPLPEDTLLKILYDDYRNQQDSDGNTVVLTDQEVYQFLEFVGSTSNDFKSTLVTSDGKKVSLRPHHFKDANDNIYSLDTLNATIDAFGRTITLPTLSPVSYYEYEIAKNDEKRQILIPPPETAKRMRKELGLLLNE